jgi:selenocysteine lyase/cysteine desulfurase
LAKVVGRVSAAKLIEAANAAIGNLINATPAEQIAAAKGSKSK